MTDENNVGPLIPEARTFALQHLFDGDEAKLESLLLGITDSEVRNCFWEFINVCFFALDPLNRTISPFLKKEAFIRFLSLFDQLRISNAFFEWYFLEINKEGAEFDEVFARYWRAVHQPLSR